MPRAVPCDAVMKELANSAYTTDNANRGAGTTLSYLQDEFENEFVDLEDDPVLSSDYNDENPDAWIEEYGVS